MNAPEPAANAKSQLTLYGVALPSRMLIRDLLPEQRPKSNDIDFDKGWQSPAMSEAQLSVVAKRWRYQRR